MIPLALYEIKKRRGRGCGAGQKGSYVLRANTEFARRGVAAAVMRLFCERTFRVGQKDDICGDVNMLEKMSDFFENRLDGYDEYMRKEIMSAEEFYPFTAKRLPMNESSHILDLGCGTGLELEEYYSLNPSARVTGIDLSKGMLSELKKKFAGKDITLILGSYFDVLFGVCVFDAAVSVESLHHFTKEEKIPLYTKLYAALKENGYFILTDYFSLSDQEEYMHRQNLIALKAEQGITDQEFYHYDTPLTVKHEAEALLEAGFSSVEALCHWGATYTLKAVK